MGTPLYTIGHGPLPFDELLRRLQRHGVRTVLDVRSQPYSSRVPQYSKADLEAELVAAGLSYRWLGHHLGGRPLRPDQVAPIDQPTEVAAGVTEAAGLAAGASCALLCAELDPTHCHRNALAGRFEDAGFTVVHILADGSPHPHQPSLGV